MPRRSAIVAELSVLGVVALAVFAALWSVQRALWTNGLVPGAAPSVLRPDADVAAGRLQTGAAVLLGLLACAVFAWFVVRCTAYRRAGLAPVAVAVPALVAVAYWLLPPTLSDDVYSYLSHGWLAATPGANPYVDPSSSVGATAYGRLLIERGWIASHPPTPYGPVWTAVERAAYSLSGDRVDLGVLLVKLPVLLSVLGIAALVHRALRPRGQDVALRGCLLFLANPLVLVELAGDGHNDALMALLLVAGVVAALERRAFWAILAVGLAVLVKSSALPLALPVLVHLVATRRSARSTALGVAGGVVVAAGIGALLIAPSWAGAATFSGLRTGGALQGWSVAGVLGKIGSVVAHAAGAGDAASSTAVQVVLLVLLIGASAVASTSARTAHGLMRACGAVSLVVLLLLPFDWPWYATMPCALLPLLPDLLDCAIVGGLAVTSRLVAPLGDAVAVRVVGYVWLYGVQTLLAQAVPSLAGLVLLVLERLPARLLPARVARLTRALEA